ncbi:MAG: hypothetical protein ACTHMS_17730 [Jatrophihabitans sp.]|uniref:hypothetical protein n=1 Tax=Jatrophihabitans sp. TaxID=1932789 RepID=UPI003F7F43BF
MSTDTEDRLRAALRVAGEQLHVEGLTLRPVDRAAPARWRRMALPLTVAAAVAAAAVGLSLAGRGHDNSAPPVTRSTVPVPTSTTVSSVPPRPPSTAAFPQAQRCDTADSTAWTAAMHGPELIGIPPGTVMAGLVYLAGVDRRGDAIAVETTNPGRLVTVRPDGTTTVLYTAPQQVDPSTPVRIGDATAPDGDWTAVSLIAGGGQGERSGIVAVNIRTRATRTVRAVGNFDLIVQTPFVAGGAVRWVESTNVGVSRGYAYDLATGRRSDVSVASATPPSGLEVRAGNLHAFQQSSGGRTHLLVQRGSEPAVDVASTDSDGLTHLLALTDRFLLWSDVHGLHLLDLRSGAGTVLDQSTLDAGAAAAAGTLAVNTESAKGGPLLGVAREADLPALHC